MDDKHVDYLEGAQAYKKEISMFKSFLEPFDYNEEISFVAYKNKLTKKYGAINKHKIICSYNLNSFREEIGQTMEEFAKTVNISMNIINNCEQAKSLLTYSNLMDANEAFNNYIEKDRKGLKKDCFLKVMTGLMKVKDIYIDSSFDSFTSSIEYAVPSKISDSRTRFTHSLGVTNISQYMKKEMFFNVFDQLSPTDQAKIMDRMEHIISTYNDEDAIPTKRIAVLGQTACGNPIEAISIADEFIETNELKANFALRAVGDSMSPLVNDGDVILIKQTEELEINDIGIFQINDSGFSDDEEVTCKMLKSIKDGVMTLMPLNPAHDPIVIDTKKQHVKVIGKYLCKA